MITHIHLHEPTEEETNEVLKSFFATVRVSREAATKAATELERHIPTLIKAILTYSGQSEKVVRIVRSCWNDSHKSGLCEDLCGLDHAIGEAVLALLAARIHMGGDADTLIKRILVESGEWRRMQSEEAAA